MIQTLRTRWVMKRAVQETRPERVKVVAAIPQNFELLGAFESSFFYVIPNNGLLCQLWFVIFSAHLLFNSCLICALYYV